VDWNYWKKGILDIGSSGGVTTTILLALVSYRFLEEGEREKSREKDAILYII
jgi:hypothetical protein